MWIINVEMKTLMFFVFCVIVSWSSSLGSSTTGLVTLTLIWRQRLWNKHIQCLNLDLVDGLNFYFQRNAANRLTHGRRMMNAATHTRCQQSLFSFIEKENPPTIICCERGRITCRLRDCKNIWKSLHQCWWVFSTVVPGKSFATRRKSYASIS